MGAGPGVGEGAGGGAGEVGRRTVEVEGVSLAAGVNAMARACGGARLVGRDVGRRSVEGAPRARRHG